MRGNPLFKATGLLLGVVMLGGGGLALLSTKNTSTVAQTGECGYYTNGQGHQVPRPCGNWRTEGASPPPGATALCEDGTYSFSEHPYYKYTCSYHGGVAKHLR
jgi:Protein of unknown function (DUF3761)